MTDTAPAAPAPGRHRSSAWVHMPGLDGVRAIAVLAVVVFHMDESWLPGGFLGVDVFFTLSGFLITSLLLAELDASDKVDFKRFYIRRARRLLPALYLVLVATSIAAMTIAQDAAQRVREDATAAFFYVTNWWYVIHGQSYFEATGRPPMLQHLWSLAVEEQFYFVWPVLCWLLWKVGRTRGVRVGAIVGALVSTAVMAWISIAQGMPAAADPSRVYFGSDTHAMTLLVGAALATVWRPGRLAASLTSRGIRTVTASGFASLLALFAIFWFVASDSPLLYRGGFLVIGVITAVFVASAAVTASAFAGLMSMQPLRWIGERSYGIYLWHWPVFMLLRPGIDLDADGLGVQALRLTLTLVLAELSYRFVETPIRHGAIGRAWARWKEVGGFAFAGRAATAAVTSIAVVVALGFGLAHAQEPTLEDALGGVQGVGDEDLTPTSAAPTPSVSGTGTGAPTQPAKPPGPPVLKAGQDAYGLSVTAVGDSVLLAARDAVVATIPKSKVDAVVSRQSWEVFQRIKDRRAAGKLGDVVVIHTGTNGTIDLGQLMDTLTLLKDRSRVILVTPKADRSWIPQATNTIKIAAKKFAGGNVRVADWQVFAQGHRDWFYADGIHTKGEGSQQYANML
ncbi:MAG: acyltransferase family protein, partial [Burkholderiales bacterium]